MIDRCGLSEIVFHTECIMHTPARLSPTVSGFGIPISAGPERGGHDPEAGNRLERRRRKGASKLVSWTLS